MKKSSLIKTLFLALGLCVASGVTANLVSLNEGPVAVHAEAPKKGLSGDLPETTTVADVLATVSNFPTNKNAGWISADGNNAAYLYANTFLKFEDRDDSTTNLLVVADNPAELSDGNYISEITGMYDAKCTFVMTNGVLSEIRVVSDYRSALSGTYTAPVMAADVLPDDFPVVYDSSIPENAWVNENGINLTLYYDELVLKTSDSARRLGLIEDVSSAVLTKNGDNYSISDEYKQITFNCVDNIATSIKVEGLSGSYAAYSDFNGTYSEPGIKDSNKDLTTSMSVRASIENGVITISGEEDGYRMELELYTYPENDMIPAGTYVISDSNEAGTALKSEGFKDDAPLKSYIALLDNDGNITDCWLLYEGTVSLSRGTVTVDATNSKGKSISVSATVCSYYTVTISVNDQMMGSVSLTTIEDVVENTVYSVNGNTLSVGQEEITPTANEGYEFDCWKIGDTEVAAGSIGSITEDTTFTAVFKEEPAASISMKSNPNKVEYVVGEELDLTGAKITVTKASGATKDIDVTASMVSGYDKNKAGSQTLTVTYEGKTCTFVVNVVEAPAPTPGNELSAGAIAGIAVGSVAAACLIAYVAMFFVWKKSEKALGFLTSSFKWINNKIFKK